MKLALEDVKAIGGYRYRQKRNTEEGARILAGVGCLIIGFVLMVVITMTAISPIDQQAIATYTINEPGQLVITGGDSAKFNDAELPVIYSTTQGGPEAGDYIVLGIGALLCVVGFACILSIIELTNDRRHAFADEFAQKWLDTGELPSKDKDEA